MGGGDFTGKESISEFHFPQAVGSPLCPTSSNKMLPTPMFPATDISDPNFCQPLGFGEEGILGELLCDPAERHQQADVHRTTAHHLTFH